MIFSNLWLFVPLLLAGLWCILGTQEFAERVAGPMLGRAGSVGHARAVVAVARAVYSLAAALLLAGVGWQHCEAASRQRHVLWLLALAFVRFAALSMAGGAEHVPFHRHADVRWLWTPMCVGVVWASTFYRLATWTVGDEWADDVWHLLHPSADGGPLFQYLIHHVGHGSLREFLVADRLQNVVGPVHAVCALLMYRDEFAGWLRAMLHFATGWLPDTCSPKHSAAARVFIVQLVSLWPVWGRTGAWHVTLGAGSVSPFAFHTQRCVGFVAGVVATMAWQFIVFQAVADDDAFFADVILSPMPRLRWPRGRPTPVVHSPAKQ